MGEGDAGGCEGEGEVGSDMWDGWKGCVHNLEVVDYAILCM